MTTKEVYYVGLIPVKVINRDHADLNYNWHITVRASDGIHKLGQSTDEQKAVKYAQRYIKNKGLKNAGIVLEPKPII